MKYAGMPQGMWLIYKKSFRNNLVSVLGLSDPGAAEVMRAAKLRYREIIEKLPEFEKGDRFKTNIVNCALFSSFALSMKELPDLDSMTIYYRESMTTKAAVKFYRMAGKRKFTLAKSRS